MKADEIMTISAIDNAQSLAAYRLLSPDKKLFLPPDHCNAAKFGIEELSIEDANEKILRLAFEDKTITENAFDYLSSQNKYELKPEKLVGMQISALSVKQVHEIIKHKKILQAFSQCSVDCIRDGNLPNWRIAYDSPSDLYAVLPEYVESDDFPSRLSSYFRSIRNQCYVSEIEGEYCLASKNMLIIPADNLLDVLEDLCYQIDKRNSFSASVKIRRSSDRLNEIVDDPEITPLEFMKELKRNRKNIKTALGDSYSSYVQHIIQAGSSSTERFINELLQNADDCYFSEGVVPSFSLTIDDRIMTSYCNEIGFSKQDLRAITAIGESTKKKLLNHETIGEKGIGFKSVFSIAEKVEIHSNQYHFQLSKEMPTLPNIVDNTKEDYSGTQMIFTLKKGFDDHFLTPDRILELCRCLRNLRTIQICNKRIVISDTESERTIDINGEKYSYFKYVHSFTVNDTQTIASRQENGKEVDPIQRVICLIPKTTPTKKEQIYHLYCGLPTSVRVNAPFYIDAPYLLTTSRDLVLHDNLWNTAVTAAVYSAVTKMIVSFREKLRSRVLSLIGIYSSQNHYGILSNRVSIFDDEKLAHPMWISELRNVAFLPTFDPDSFVKPNDCCWRYPPVVTNLLKKGKTISVPSDTILDIPADTFDSVLKELNCNYVSASKVLDAVSEHIETYVFDESLRKSLYSYGNL